MLHDHGAGIVDPCGLTGIFDAIGYGGDIFDAHRRAIFVSDDDRLIFRAGKDLIVSADGISLTRAVDIALGLILVGIG